MTEFLNNLSQHWWTWHIAMLWQATVLIAIIWGIDRLIRKWAHPQLRYALWMLVIIKLFIPPTLTSPISITSRIPQLANQTINIQLQNSKSPNVPARSASAGIDPQLPTQ